MTATTATGPLWPLTGQSIEVQGLTKRYGKVLAVDNLTFTAEPGRVTGLVGPNGAGKTTVLRAVLGLANPTAGRTTISGVPYRELPQPIRQVGAVLEATGLHPFRRARTHLKTMAIAGGLPPTRVAEVLQLVGLSGVAQRRVGDFSLGMRRRLELAGALLGNPGVLVLDEPSNGLDPEGIHWLISLLRRLAEEGRTVLVASHLLSELEQCVDDVVIVTQGRLIRKAPLSELTRYGQATMRVRTPEAERLMGVLETAGAGSRRVATDVVVVDGATPEWLGPILAQKQIVFYELTSESGLEQVFLSLTSGTGFLGQSFDSQSLPIRPGTPGAPPPADVWEPTSRGWDVL